LAITRVVIKFDLTQIPVNASVTNATLSIYLWGDMQQEGKCKAFKLTTKFTENSVNWQIPWKTLGGDYDPSKVEGEVTVRRVGDEGYNNIPVTKAVQDFVKNPALNNGFLLIFFPDQNSEKLTRKIYLSEYSIASYRPYLNVTYSGTPIIKKDNTVYSPNIIKITQKDGMLVLKGFSQSIHQIEIYSVQGKRIANYMHPISSNSSQVSVPFSKSGVFIVTIKDDKGIINKKIINE